MALTQRLEGAALLRSETTFRSRVGAFIGSIAMRLPFSKRYSLRSPFPLPEYGYIIGATRPAITHSALDKVPNSALKKAAEGGAETRRNDKTPQARTKRGNCGVFELEHSICAAMRRRVLSVGEVEKHHPLLRAANGADLECLLLRPFVAAAAALPLDLFGLFVDGA